MKRMFAPLILLLCAGMSFAQPATDKNNFKVTFGPVFDFPKKHEDLGFIGTKDDGAVQLSYKRGSDLTIQKLDNKLAVGKSYTADISKMPGSFINDKFLDLGNKYYWFYSTWDKKEEKEHLFAQEISVKEGKLTGSAKSLITATKLEGSLIATGFYSFNKANKYQFNKNYDGSRLLVTYRLLHTTKDDSKSKETVGFNVYNNALEKQWSKEITMPYTEEMMDIEDYEVDKAGNAYVLIKVYEGKKKEKGKDGAPNYHMELLKSSGGELKVIPIKLDGHFINDIIVADDADGNLRLTGFYSNEARNSSDGVFAVKVDAEGRVTKVHKGYYEFPNEIIKQFMSDRAKKKADKKESDGKDTEVSALKLRNVIINDDGSMLIAGEVYWFWITISSSSRGVTTYYHYRYNDLMVMKINAAGDMEWCRKVPKRQSAQTTNYYSSAPVGNTSFKMFEYDGDYYFFYTDNVKNLNLPIDKEPAYHANGFGGFLVYTKIDKDGKVSKGKFFDYREKKFNLLPTDFQSLGGNTIVNRAFDGKKSQVLTIAMQK